MPLDQCFQQIENVGSSIVEFSIPLVLFFFYSRISFGTKYTVYEGLCLSFYLTKDCIGVSFFSCEPIKVKFHIFVIAVIKNIVYYEYPGTIW